MFLIVLFNRRWKVFYCSVELKFSDVSLLVVVLGKVENGYFEYSNKSAVNNVAVAAVYSVVDLDVSWIQ